MAKELKSVRFDPEVLVLIEDYIKKHSYPEEGNIITFNEAVQTLVYNQLRFITRELVTIEGEWFYPVHVSRDEFEVLLGDCMEAMGDAKITTIMARKSHGGKGIDFMLSDYSRRENGTIFPTKRYSFSIDPNWQVNDFFDHYTKEFGVNCIAEKKNYNPLKSISSIIENRRRNKIKPEGVNHFFEDYEWKILYERQQTSYLFDNKMKRFKGQNGD